MSDTWSAGCGLYSGLIFKHFIAVFTGKTVQYTACLDLHKWLCNVLESCSFISHTDFSDAGVGVEMEARAGVKVRATSKQETS